MKKMTTRGSRMEDAAEWKGELSDTKDSLASTQDYVNNVKTTFQLKKESFERNQQVRQEELDALTKAIEIISSNSVQGNAEKHLPTLVQKATAFVQLRSTNRRLANENMTQFLQENAHRLNSKVLQMAAVKVAEGGPLDKVIKMIQDLVARLESEAAEEADHKAFCDEELKQNKLTREEKTAKVEELQTQIDRLTATINKLAQEISDLEAQQSHLAKAMSEATKERFEEKEKNEATIKDAKEAQSALSQALEVLRAFYQKAGGGGEETALVQQVPEMAEYKGQQNSKGGVVGMLEVIASDFARLEADTSSAESQAQREYDQFMTKGKADKEKKHKDAFDKTMLKDRKEHNRKMTNKDFRAVSQELQAANEAYDALKPQCLEVHVSYEERVRKRQEEIEALQQAYAIFSEKA